MTKSFIAVSFVALFLSAGGWISPGWADTKGSENQFSLVQGAVKVVSGGGTTRKAIQGGAAYPGETIQVGSKGAAQLTLFDGSTLDLSSDSKVTLKELQHSSDKDKVISLKLALGKVFAQVKKLLSAKSSFEIEAGGVVCGVRGTAFSVDFNPDTHKMDLNVFDGKVGATSGGNTLFFTAGQTGHFLNGQLNGTGTNSGNPTGKPGGKGGTTGGTSNGSNGNGSSSSSNSNSNGGSNGNGGNNPGSGENGGTGSNTSTGTTSNNVGTGTTNDVSPGSGNTNELDSNTALGDLNNQFTQGILVNGDNNLNSAQQSINIHLVVPSQEAVP